MPLSVNRYDVGDTLYHADYGEGMVVEVRPRPFFDVLEVAFADGVRRLNSNHPKVTAAPPRQPSSVSHRRASAPPAGSQRARVLPRPGDDRNGHGPAARNGASPESTRAGRPEPEATGAGRPTTDPRDPTGAAGAPTRRRATVRRAPEQPSSTDETAAQRDPALGRGDETPVSDPVEPTDAGSVVEYEYEFEHPHILRLDRSTLDAALAIQSAPADGGRRFLEAAIAARLSLTHGFRDLLALSAVRDLEQYDFQIQAVRRVLHQMRGRAILADEVGLGKTIEAGLILKEYALRGLVRRALVLTPVSLMSQWREELRHKFDLPFEVRARGEEWSRHPFLIASIDTAKTARHRAEIGAAGFDLLVVDEAHRLRNHLTQGWKFVDALRLKYLLLLTATPVQNDLRELYNLVTLLEPGLLGTYRSFRKDYMVRGDKRLPKQTKELAEKLGRVMVRTSRSSTSLSFPRREVRIVPFTMSKTERALYDGVSEFVRDAVEAGDARDLPRWNFLLMVLQKEMGSTAYAATRTLERSAVIFKDTQFAARLESLAALGRSVRSHAKIEGLIKVIRDQGDDKVLVFTQFRRSLDAISERLRAEGISFASFHGSLSPAAKDAAIEAFRGGVQVLLSTEAGGEGRNLQFCRNLVNFDLPWNPMRLEQRIGRIHRLGQTRDTRIWNFTTRNTVEDYVLKILDEKIQMFELVIGEMDMVLGQWSDRESFENEVFRIWSRNRTAAEREREFDALADDLLIARERHERVKDLDAEIFSRLESSWGVDKGEGRA